MANSERHPALTQPKMSLIHLDLLRASPACHFHVAVPKLAACFVHLGHTNFCKPRWTSIRTESQFQVAGRCPL